MVIKSSDGSELRFKNPGSLLIIVIAFLFWGIGFLDLLGHTSAEPAVFGLYSAPFFIILVLYGLTILIWIALFVNANLLSRANNAIRRLQENTWLAIGAFAGIGIALWVILEWGRWSRLPVLQAAAFGLVLLAAAILLFSNWNDGKNKQWWRKVIVYPLIFLVAVEAVIQIVAYLGLLPGIHSIGGDFAPYERIYYNAEGYRNGYANRYGWYFPDFSMDDEKERVLIVGGSFAQALQVEPEQQVSARLSELVNNNPSGEGAQTEIIAIGLPGFGLSPFLYDTILTELPGIIRFDEMVVLFHLGDDFPSPTPFADPIYYTLNQAGEAEVHPDDARLRHDLTHYYLGGYQAFQLVETIRSNYLTPKVFTGLVRNRVGETAGADIATRNSENDLPRLRGYVSDNYTITEPGHAGIKSTNLIRVPQGNNFMFSEGGNEGASAAINLARSILETAQEIAVEHGITLRLVTIPTFPQAFYQEFQTGPWDPTFGGYDLFGPEDALIGIAQENGIPILPMGNYMYANGLTTQEIKELHFADGLGHLSPQGHEYFAAAIYSCFYSDQPQESCLGN